jgi:protein-L-isoaspartate(D-aspartate) O-methyltransferase
MRDADFARQRAALIEHLRREGIRNDRVLDAMAKVPRQLFVPEDLVDEAYADRALPIGSGQTISQPFVVARMTELLDPRPTDRVLEIGTGSGYQTAILAVLVDEVVSVERHRELFETARERLAELGLTNALLVVGDGSAGYPPRAPYDGVLITAATPRLPEPVLAQSATGARIVAPVGEREFQQLTVFEKRDGLSRSAVEPVKFVPLVGRHGFEDDR